MLLVTEIMGFYVLPNHYHDCHVDKKPSHWCILLLLNPNRLVCDTSWTSLVHLISISAAYRSYGVVVRKPRSRGRINLEWGVGLGQNKKHKHWRGRPLYMCIRLASKLNPKNIYALYFFSVTEETQFFMPCLRIAFDWATKHRNIDADVFVNDTL